jgi:hypothetical protein
LQIEIEKNNRRDHNKRLIINHNERLIAKEGQLYLQGILKQAQPNSYVEIEGNLIPIVDEVFEGFINNKNISEKDNIIVNVFENNRLIETKKINVDHYTEADFIYPYIPKSNCLSKFVDPLEDVKLIYSESDVELEIKQGSLDQLSELTVTKLREIDIAPMNAGLVNVTLEGKAFRFTPDGISFNKPVKISIKYDPEILPANKSPYDIRTYYFNISKKRWEPIEIDTIDVEKCIITSYTTHFSDYINGIIQVPESPQTSAFAPTMMKDIKAADPSANVTIISPPDPNQSGDAVLNYPIKIPNGRNGMQPNLSIQYNSSGGSSWLGTGWSLNIPGISLDTRWGVPTFGDKNGDGDFEDEGENIETEIYRLNGNQLMYPKYKDVDWMPHRHYNVENDIYSTVERPRLDESEAIFTNRIQGDFAIIQRFGNSPKNYYWKVITTDGTTHWYGGKSISDVEGWRAVKKDFDGNVIYWALFFSEDVHGNTIKYTYENAVFEDTESTLAGGRSFYPTQINYTGFQGSEGNYTITFIKSEEIRTDAAIDYRNGFKDVDPLLLERIEVNYLQELIRSYKLGYTQGRFEKTLLQWVSENDDEDKEFYRHVFDYYDDVANGYFGDPEMIEVCPEKCFSVEFPVPSVDTTIFYYESNKGVIIGDEQCTQTSAGSIKSLLINSTEHFPPDNNLYYTHYTQQVGHTNLCPHYPIQNPYPPDPVTQNPDFNQQCQLWLENVLSPYEPFNVFVNNQSGVYLQNGLIEQYNIAYASFFSINNISDTLRFTHFFPHHPLLFPHGSVFYKHPIQGSVSIPVTITVTTSNSIKSFGPYNLSSEIDIQNFENDFIESFPGIPPPTVRRINNTVSIYVPSTKELFQNITLNGGGISLSYEFNNCGTPEKTINNIKGKWNNAKLSENNIIQGLRMTLKDNPLITLPINQQSFEKSIHINGNIMLENGHYKIIINKDGHKWYGPGGKELMNPIDIEDINNASLTNINSQYSGYNTRNHSEIKNIREKVQTHLFNNGTQEPSHKLDTDLTENQIANQIVEQFVKRRELQKTKINSNTGSYHFTKVTHLKEFQGNDCEYIINPDFGLQIFTNLFNSSASVLGSNKSFSFNAGAYLGIGTGIKIFTKSTTFGLQINYGEDYADGWISFTDLDGDGLDDRVRVDDNKVFYSKHIIYQEADETGTLVNKHTFLPEKQIVGLSNTFYQKSSTKSSNLQTTFGIGFVGLDYRQSTSHTKIYFTDANGDGLTDIVMNGVVLFNYLDKGIPTFINTTLPTENLLIMAEAMEVELPGDDFQETITMPANDVVKIWEAPASGIIQIENDIELLNNSSEALVTIEMKSENMDNCYEVVFPIPMASIYHYGVSCYPAHAEIIANACLYPETVSKINSFEFLGQEHFPPNDIYLNHYTSGIGVNNLCPTTPPEDGWTNTTQNIDFGNAAADWYSTILTQAGYPTHILWADNYTDITYENNIAHHFFGYQISFPSQWDLPELDPNMKSTFWIEMDSEDVLITQGFDAGHVGEIEIPVSYITVVIETTNGYHQFGPYENLVDQIFIDLFETDLQNEFGTGTTVNIIEEEIHIQIPNSDIEIYYIILRRTNDYDNGDYNYIVTYYFSLCGIETLYAHADNKDWANYTPAKDDYEWALTRAIANGYEMNMPIPEPSINYIFRIPAGSQNDTTLQNYVMKMKEGEHSWYFPDGNQVSNLTLIEQLESQLPVNIEALFSDSKVHYVENIKTQRLQSQAKAQIKVKEYFENIPVTIRMKSNISRTTQQSCEVDPGNACLLFGAILNAGQPIISNTITQTSQHCDKETPLLYVDKGDKIYFRVHSRDNKTTEVNWNPTITYTDSALQNVTDQNGISLYSSSYSDGFILSTGRPTILPGNGEASISWNSFYLNNLSDDVELRIIMDKTTIVDGIESTVSTEIYSFQYVHGQTYIPVTSAGISNIFVDDFDYDPPVLTSLRFEVFSKSNVAWNQFSWKPVVTYEQTNTILDEEGQPDAEIESIELIQGLVNYSVYKQHTCDNQYQLFNVGSIGGYGLTIQPQLSGIFDSEANGTLYFTVKANESLIGSRILTISSGNVTIDDSSPISIPFYNGHIEIGYYGDDSSPEFEQTSLIGKLTEATNHLATIQSSNGTTNLYKSDINLFHKPNQLFGPMYRQWGQIMYNPKVVSGATKINELDCFLLRDDLLEDISAISAQIEQAIDELNNTDFSGFNPDNSTDLDNLVNFFENFHSTHENLLKQPFIKANPKRILQDGQFFEKWVGLHDDCYASKYTSKSTIMNMTYEKYEDSSNEVIPVLLETGAVAIDRKSKNSSFNVSGGIAVIGNINKSIANISTILTDYQDINGDRYPDIISTEKIQYSKRTGGLYKAVSRTSSLSGNIGISDGGALGYGASGSFWGRDNSSAGISGNFSSSNESSTKSWTDINGDGLPDLVEYIDNQLIVLLNTGRNISYTSANWGNNQISASNSKSYGGGLGING